MGWVGLVGSWKMDPRPCLLHTTCHFFVCFWTAQPYWRLTESSVEFRPTQMHCKIDFIGCCHWVGLPVISMYRTRDNEVRVVNLLAVKSIRIAIAILCEFLSQILFASHCQNGRNVLLCENLSRKSRALLHWLLHRYGITAIPRVILKKNVLQYLLQSTENVLQ